jgi:hypothetical protein
VHLLNGVSDSSTPNAAEVQKILDQFQHTDLLAYEIPGNALARTYYDALTFPWQVTPAVTGFPEDGYRRFEWGRNGAAEPGQKVLHGGEITLDSMSAVIGTESPVTRWREAHPDLVGTSDDIVAKLAATVKEAMAGKDTISIGMGTALLIFKRA